MGIRSNLNNKQGLYDPANEHDACGVGLVVNVHGGRVGSDWKISACMLKGQTY